MRTARVILVVGLIVALTGASWGQQRYGGQASEGPRHFTHGQLRTLSGKVGQMGQMELMQKIELQTDQGEPMTVVLAPQSFLQQHELELSQGQSVMVTGWKAWHQGEVVLVAHQLQADGQTVTMRTPQGQPHWPVQAQQYGGQEGPYGERFGYYADEPYDPQTRAQRQREEERWQAQRQREYEQRYGEAEGFREPERETLQAQRPGMSASWMMTSTDLVGMKIRDRYGDEIGNVDNLLVNPQTGDVEAVVVWAGGWVFGIGGEKVAVPYWAFEPRPREEYMVINATQRQLTASPSFSDQNWREQVDRQWSQRLDSYWSDVIEGAPATTGVYEPAVYPQEPTRPRIMLVQDWGNEPSAQSGDWFEEEKAWQSETRAQEDDWLADRQAWQKEPREHEQEWFEDEAWGGEDEAAMPAEDWTQQEQAWPHTYEAGDLMLVSEVVGAKLRTSNGEEFGQIANVLVDSRYGKAAYAVVSYGGVLGLGQAMTVVPWTAMDFRGPDQDAYVTADAQTLKRFEFSNLSEMPDVTNHAEAQRIHRAYAAQPYWHGERPVAQERAQRFGRKWNSPPMQTNGTIEEVATFTWQNAQTHTGTKLMVKTPDGEMVTVLVAPESYVKQQQMDFTKGQQVTVTGWQGRLHGEQVLSAQKIQMAEKTFALRDQYGQPQWSGRYRLEQMDFAQEGFSDNPLIEAKGQIQQVSDFTWQAQGLSHTGKQFTLKTDDGQMMTVLVAPTSYLQRRQIQFQQGREATVSGWQSQHHGQPVIVARTVETDERMLTLRDRQGAPEWPAPLARRLARGPLMETKGRIEQVSQFQWQSGGQTYTGEQMIVQTDEGDRVTVLVAPTQFLQQRNIRLWPGEQVMVRGWQSTFRGEQVLTARTIETQEKTIVLRDRRGRPEWSGWQPMQRPTTS